MLSENNDIGSIRVRCLETDLFGKKMGVFIWIPCTRSEFHL